MGLSCGAKFFKYCLFAFNLIFFITGCVCLGIGIWLIVTKGDAINDIYDALEKTTDLKPEDKVENDLAFRDLGILMAAAGGLVLIISFLGCCGAVKEWRPLLIAYSVALLVVLAIEIAAAVYAGINKNSMDDKIKIGMEKSLKYYKISDGVGKAWRALMKERECCGVTSGNAVEEFKAINQTALPNACCPETESEGDHCEEKDAYMTGCYNSLKDWFNGKLAIVIGVGAAVAVFLIIGIVFALCLCQAISKDAGAYA